MLNTTEYANSLFEQPWWLDIVAPEQWKEFTIKNAKGEVIARMPYVVEYSRIVLPEKTQHLGIWMSEEVRNDYTAQKNVINEIFGELKTYPSVYHALSPINEYILPLRWLGYTFNVKFTYRIEELSSLDAVYKRFSKSAKRDIKYAEKRVKLSHDLSVKNMLKLLDITYEAQNRKYPVDKKLIEKIMETCVKNDTGEYIEAQDEQGNVHSCAFFIYDKDVCYYSIGAHDPQFSSSCSQTLILWEGIKFASEHSKIFDFEGSMVEGIEQFFRKFGGICRPYYVVTKSNIVTELMEAAKPHVKRMIGYKI